MSDLLKDKWVLITGASSGFGAASARAFARCGARLILGARRTDRLEAVAAECSGSPQVVFHHLDVASTPSVEEFFAWIRGITPKLDVLVNNAGGAHGIDPVATATDSDWEAMMQSNVLGVLRMCRAALPIIQGGHIINIGSIAGHVAYEGGAAYCAAKAGELQITRALRLEVNGTGTRVSTIDPGLAETEFAMVRYKGDETRAKKTYEGMTPLVGEDIAEAVLWVASRPAHVCIDEMIVKPTDQAAIHKVFRKPAK